MTEASSGWHEGKKFLSTMIRNGDKTLIGVMLTLTTSVAIAAVGALGKFAQQSVNALEVVFIQNVVSLIIILPIVLWKRGVKGLATSKLRLHLIRDFGGLIAYLTFFYTLNYIPLADAVLLNNTGPLFVPFLFFFFLHYKIPPKLWWGIIIGFIGILIILQPGLGIFHPAMLIGLVSGLGTAVVLAAITLLNRTEGPFLMLFYYFLVASIVMTPLAIWKWVPTSLEVWATMVGIGLLMIMVQLSLTLALKQGEIATLSPLLYFAVIWSGLIDWIAWGSLLHWIALIGAGLVIAGATLSILFRPPYKPKGTHA